MSYYHPRKAFGNEDVIYKARQYENALQERVKFVHEYETLMRYAQFEELNGPRSWHRCLAEKLAGMREEREQALLHRRRRLSLLLTAEDTSLHNEMKSGNMNLAQRRAWLLSQALALSSSGAPELTNLQKALLHDDVSMHNSKLAIRRTEAEITKKQHHHDGRLDGNLLLQQPALNILRQHLFLVEQLRELEKAAVEEDMISMHRTWLEEEEALKLKQLERRHHDSLQVQDQLLLCKVEERKSEREDDQDHVVAMATHKETEEEKQLEELRAVHKGEALAYVSQLKAAAERQIIEDEELQATIKAKMFHPPGADNLGTGKMAGYIDRIHDNNNDAEEIGRMSELSKADVLEGKTRSFHAAELVDQEVKRLALQGHKDYKRTSMSKPISMDLPYPEPYYGRKAVNWYG